MNRPTIWIAILRASGAVAEESGVSVEGIITLSEMVAKSHELDLRMRFNPDLRLVTMRLPPGTRRDQMYEAFNLLSHEERCRLYNLPQHPMGEDV